MPRTKSTKKKSPTVSKIVCSKCGEDKRSTDYYNSSSVFHSGTGKVPFCKECLKEMALSKDGTIDNYKLKQVLKEIDKPYIYHVLQSAYNDTKEKSEEGNITERDAVGSYFRMINSLPQYKSLTWANSTFEPEAEDEKRGLHGEEVFKMDDEIVEFFGAGYSNEEYEAMQRKYIFLKNNYPEKTNMHIEALKSYVRYKVKEEFAIANNDVVSAGKWADMANKAAQNAKINPSQLSKADLSDGLSSFSELSQSVEKEVDIISILPKFKYRPNDVPDFIIWCYVNYMRDLSALPPCEYEDVYKFYDARKKDYIEQYGDPYGVFTDDTTEENRDKIKKFITKEDGD